ncbi:AFG1-like ATPase-domain-containing protein [Pisolithus sp. B1]|nr:AFG1-like ATPase-domain-containing protein [Pisolithus sp. B1]
MRAAIRVHCVRRLRRWPVHLASQSSVAGTASATPSILNTATACPTSVKLAASSTPTHLASSPLQPLQEYDALVSAGTLKLDPHQRRIVERHLQPFYTSLLSYSPPPVPPPPSSTFAPTLFSRLFARSTLSSPGGPPKHAPKGLYLYGDVGTGKTMLMDLFYLSLPPSITRKRRVHFHAFMIDVHKRIHAAKAAMGAQDGGDPIAPVARDLAREAYVLCFDEFQVTDIADAMILRRLFESLLRYGVVMVITSNRHPDDLYKNGIQRSSFIPAIELLKSQFQVTDLDSGTDYRRIPRALSHVYYSPLTPENKAEVDKIFRSLTTRSSSSSSRTDLIIANRPLTTFGRTIYVPLSTSHVARFTFEELCARPLSAADYLEITRTFGTIFITDVPKLDIGRKDVARRFITFIDACYESKTKLFVLSEVPIFQIFSDDGTSAKGQISDHMRSVMDDLGLAPEVVGASSMFTGEEEIFAFARACSRLVQMGSKEWAETAGRS